MQNMATHCILDSHERRMLMPWILRGSVRQRTRVPLTRALADSCSLPLKMIFVSLSLRGTREISDLCCQDGMTECIVKIDALPYLISNKRALLVFPMLERKLGAILVESEQTERRRTRCSTDTACHRGQAM